MDHGWGFRPYVRVADSQDLIAKFKETATGRMFQDPQIAPLVMQLYGSVEEQWKEIEEVNERVKPFKVLRGVEANAAIVTEPTSFDVWISCRGTSYADVVVPGHGAPFRVRT